MMHNFNSALKTTVNSLLLALLLVLPVHPKTDKR